MPWHVRWLCIVGYCFLALTNVGQSYELFLRGRKLTWASFKPLAMHHHPAQSFLKISGGSTVSNNDLSSSASKLKKLVSQFTHRLHSSPVDYSAMQFNSITCIIMATALVLKFATNYRNERKNKGIWNENPKKPKEVQSLQNRFLVVFWLLRMADWLQGPYFYEVYSRKIVNGVPATTQLISIFFLTGFATTGICGPLMGRFVDKVGRRYGVLLYTLLYIISAISTRATHLSVLLLGRVAGGLGTALLFSAPEAWLVGSFQRQTFDVKWLEQTFGWAYSGDSILAILAGQLASWAVKNIGHNSATGPFTLSIGVLLVAFILTTLLWKENVPLQEQVSNDSSSFSLAGNGPQKYPSASIANAWSMVVKNRSIYLLGAVHALFEGAMYIFVLQWAPIVQAVLARSWKLKAFPDSIPMVVPFGSIFSCFMASCLLGSTVFGILQNEQSTSSAACERNMTIMLSLASLSMLVAAKLGLQKLNWLIPSLVLFEMCVGLYFPSMGALRSKYLPENCRSIIMNLFGIPLNFFVVSVFLSIQHLKADGALTIASAALALATVCSAMLTKLAAAN